jgi:hypothetical protein
MLVWVVALEDGFSERWDSCRFEDPSVTGVIGRAGIARGRGTVTTWHGYLFPQLSEKRRQTGLTI